MCWFWIWMEAIISCLGISGTWFGNGFSWGFSWFPFCYQGECGDISSNRQLHILPHSSFPVAFVFGSSTLYCWHEQPPARGPDPTHSRFFICPALSFTICNTLLNSRQSSACMYNVKLFMILILTGLHIYCYGTWLDPVMTECSTLQAKWSWPTECVAALPACSTELGM
jgi:hypothetical protein